MKIAVIDNYDSFVYNLVRYLKEHSEVKVDVFRNNQLNIESLNDYDAFLLSPGPGIPSEAGQLMEVIKSYSATKPMLGICLGHQAIAEYFGASIHPSPKVLHGKSSKAKLAIKDGIFFKLPSEIEIGRYHSWSVSTLSDCLDCTAETEGEIMALQHRTLPIIGLQFHPESVLTPHGRQIINNWIKSIEL